MELINQKQGVEIFLTKYDKRGMSIYADTIGLIPGKKITNVRIDTTAPTDYKSGKGMEVVINIELGDGDD